MLKNSFLFGIVVSFFLLLNSCSQKFHTYEGKIYSNDDMPSEPGKCYARCLMQDKFKWTEHEYYAYTGDQVELEGVSKTKKEIIPASTKWEKRKADRNCLSDDPDDCMVWCLVKVPGVFEDQYTVVDTNLVKDFEIRRTKTKELETAGGFTQWREVICDSDITPAFYMKVQQALIDAGYEVGLHGADGRKSPELKAALVKYQRAKELPVGQMDLETLASLGLTI